MWPYMYAKDRGFLDTLRSSAASTALPILDANGQASANIHFVDERRPPDLPTVKVTIEQALPVLSRVDMFNDEVH